MPVACSSGVCGPPADVEHAPGTARWPDLGGAHAGWRTGGGWVIDPRAARVLMSRQGCGTGRVACSVIGATATSKLSAQLWCGTRGDHLAAVAQQQRKAFDRVGGAGRAVITGTGR